MVIPLSGKFYIFEGKVRNFKTQYSVAAMLLCIFDGGLPLKQANFCLMKN